MIERPRAREDLFVVGIGHPLRGDDRVGLELVHRLRDHFEGGFNGDAMYEMDVGLADKLSRFEHLLVIDGAVPASEDKDDRKSISR